MEMSDEDRKMQSAAASDNVANQNTNPAQEVGDNE